MSMSFLRESDHQYREGIELRPERGRHFETNVRGVHVIGAAAGSPLLKTCINEGVQAVRGLSRVLGRAEGEAAKESSADDRVDLVIVGAGPTGLAAALEAKKRGFSFVLLEKARALNTIRNFPDGKHVYAEPAGMRSLGDLWLDDALKEELLERWGAVAADLPIELGAEVSGIETSSGRIRVRTSDDRRFLGRRVLIAIGRMGNPRLLGVPGEELPCVYSALLNPGKYAQRDLVVVGGGNSAAEAALALKGGNRVTLVHRGDEFPRLSKVNRSLLLAAEGAGQIEILRKCGVSAFREGEIELNTEAGVDKRPMACAFVLIGSDPPTSFLKRLRVRFEGAWFGWRLVHLAWVFALVYAIYGTKNGLWPFGGVYGFMMHHQVDPAMLYGLAYSILMSVFGARALRKYKHDPYQVKRYGALVAFQWLIYFGLPWGLWYLFSYGEYWRAWGVVLPYPLGYYALWEPGGRLFSDSLLPWALASLLAFAILIPVSAVFHGKRFCSWMCPCGGLAETVGDAWRHKAPRGGGVRRIEVSSTIVFIITVLGSIYLISGYRGFVDPAAFKTSYKWVVDLGLASMVAITLYPFSGGRIWCRFFCPLAKWLELVGRWSGGKLAILANDECISCGECTRYCQMGIDVRSFAQRQVPLTNASTCCVFCGICVTVCPVDVLRLGRRDKQALESELNAP